MNLVEEEAPTVMGKSVSIFESGSTPLPIPGPAERSECQVCLRCFAYQVGQSLYRAECIDLDIGVEADSLEGAVRGLGDAMYGYLMVVLEGIETNEQVPAAVLRPSPLGHRIHYHFGLLIHKITSAFRTKQPPHRKFYRTPYGLDSAHCQI